MTSDDIITEIKTSILKEEFGFECHCEQGYTKTYSNNNINFCYEPSKVYRYKAIRIHINQKFDDYSVTAPLSIDDITTYKTIIEQLIGVFKDYGKITITSFDLSANAYSSFKLLLTLNHKEVNIPDYESFTGFFNKFRCRWRRSYNLATKNLNYSVSKTGLILTANENKVSKIYPNIKKSLCGMMDREFNSWSEPVYKYEIKSLSDKKIEVIYRGREENDFL